MKKNKRKNQATASNASTPQYSIVIPLTNSVVLDKIGYVFNELSEKHINNIEVVLTGHFSITNNLEMIETNNALNQINKTGKLKVVKNDNSLSKVELIRHGLQETINENIVLLDPDHINNTINLNSLLFNNNEINKYLTNKKLFIYLTKFSRVKHLKSFNHSICLFKKELGTYLFNRINNNDKAIYHEILFYLKRLDIPIHYYKIDKEDFFTPFLPKKNVFQRKGIAIKAFLNWFFRVPFKDMREKAHNTHSFIKEHPIYRFIFVSLIVLLFFLMPILSLDSGISGDEPKFQYPQAVKLFNFYKTFGEDTSYMASPGKFYTYGMSFDTFTIFVIKTFNIENVYEARHIMNSLMGWLAILFAGLAAFSILGWRAGIIAAFLLFFSPKFLGHAYNNPKDIPFAAGYIMSVYYMIVFFKQFPHISRTTFVMLAVGIAISLSNRVGGLLLIPYFGLFAGLYYISTRPLNALFNKYNTRILKRLAFMVIGISLLGYFMAMPLWPYGLTNPITHPYKSLQFLSQYTASLKQLFDGKLMWSDNFPWYYLPRYFLITTPIVVLLGTGFLLITYHLRDHKLERFFKFIVLFTLIFPVAYIIAIDSNVYGGIRHVLFVYPSLIIAGALGLDKILGLIKNKKIQVASLAIIPVIGYSPIKHTIKNHPYEYIYYNELVGGVNGAYGDYEMDYYFHSMREGSYWVADNVLDKKYDSALIVRTNHPEMVRYYIGDYEEKGQIKIRYCRYYDRGEHDWDYGIFANSYIAPYQQKHNIWPPKNTIHAIKVDKAVICSILKRKDKHDLWGYKALQNKNYEKAIYHLKKSIKNNPYNETAFLNLAKAYGSIQNYDAAIRISYRVLKIYPNYEQALNLLGISYLRKGEYNKALGTFNKITQVNYKYSGAYYNMGIAYLRLNKPYEAIRYFKECINVNQRYKPAYYMIAEVLNKLGRKKEARQYIKVAKSI
jgi:tetratricopeptide (TPR) repeat protein